MLQAFQEIILPDVRINFSTDGKGILIIKETAKDSKIKKLHIEGVPEESFAFTLDYQPKQNARFFKQLSCYVNPTNDKGINKGCDLVVVTYINNQLKILILDMKSDKPNIADTEKQLLNSELYVTYIISMIEHHYEINISDFNISYQRTMITTRISKDSPYKPNSGKYDRQKSFYPVPVRVKNEEASVNFGRLFNT